MTNRRELFCRCGRPVEAGVEALAATCSQCVLARSSRPAPVAQEPKSPPPITRQGRLFSGVA